MKEVSWNNVKKQTAGLAIAKTVAVACVGKTLKVAERLLKLNKVSFRTNEDGDLSTTDEVANRVNLEVSGGVVKKAFLG